MSPASPTPSDIYPCLTYRNASTAIEWLCTAFDFRKRLVVPGPNDSITHSELSLGTGVIMVSSPKPESGRLSPDAPGGDRATICVFVDDPDEHCRRAISAGAVIVQPIQDQDYGGRGYGAEDLEGHRWYFSSYRPGDYWDADEPKTATS